MTTDALPILKDIIGDFAPEKFSRFFRAKSRQFAGRDDDLSPYNDADFAAGKKQGEIKFSDGDQLLICAFAAQKPLSERSGKKAQYEKAKKILKEMQVYAAGIFIFYDHNGNFRFSLVYPESTGAKRQWNNFRRFTYFVSAEFTNKTFLNRIGDGDFSSLEKIKDAFSVEKVTKEFYEAIAHWYFWALDHSHFPKDAEAEDNGRNISVIRLITRIIFIWFMRERGLVPKALFDEKSIPAILKDISPNESTYYKAILQNLFFATLSTKKAERQLRSETRGHHGYNPDFGNQYVYRYHEYFRQPEDIKDFFSEIPFLNGGLFECLDDKANGIYIDGFTATKKNQPEIPNLLFFSAEKMVNLNKHFGTNNKKYKVRGLFDILSSFNFTIDENTADDQDVALDPELLGRVFENLLASFNPETATTARKATGSYYTPREIVDYMVQESLKAYFKTHLTGIADTDIKLEQLLSADSAENPFSNEESKTIVNLIESVKIVDPAVGSGAFPMGALNKLVFILNKVDAGNELWKQAQLAVVESMPDSSLRRETRNRIEEFFKGKNADYGRKLYLIQKCIYGVDVQQIAVEIAKLRFFISLLVDEKIDKTKDNWGIEPLPNLDFKIMQGNSLISSFMGIDFDNGEEKQDGHKQAGLAFMDEDDALIKSFEQKKIDFQSESTADKKSKLREEIDDLLIKIFETKMKKQMSEYFKEIEAIKRRNSVLPNMQTREEMIAKEKQKLSQRMNFDLEDIEKKLREFTSKKKTRPFFPWKLYFAEVFEKGGFDVVIGNPPYIEARKIEQVDVDYFRKEFFTAGNRVNTFSFFSEKGINLLSDEGVLTYIIHRNSIRSNDYNKLRKYILDNTSILNILSFKIGVFENVTGEVIVLITKKTKAKENHQIKIAFCNDTIDNDMFYKSIKQQIFHHLPDYRFNIYLTEGLINQLNRIKQNCNLLEQVASITQGIIVGNEKKLVIKSKLKNNYRPILRGKNISKYNLSFENEFVNYYPGTKVLTRGKTADLFEVPEKILTQHVSSKIIATLDINQFYYLQTINGIISTDSQFPNKYLLALLNSNVLNFYYEFTFNMGAEFTTAVAIENLSQLPIKKTKSTSVFCSIVKYIFAANSTSKSFFERLIDSMVYELYFPEEIKIADADVLKHLLILPELKDDWPDEKKVEVIEKVYKELSDPKHQVSIAMGRQKNMPEIRLIEESSAPSGVERDK